MDPLLQEELLKGIIKQCPNCSILTQKIDGCNYLVCTVCKIRWCFLCGSEKYKNCNDLSHNSH